MEQTIDQAAGRRRLETWLGQTTENSDEDKTRHFCAPPPRLLLSNQR